MNCLIYNITITLIEVIQRINYQIFRKCIYYENTYFKSENKYNYIYFTWLDEIF